ncbi:unnamed protein product [Vitrella brassicaformis CCMP3155]|uniref:Uncharacterized protein n=1 Tax=Vitrella brassicaformis (strain CCMP3155) TaxID=1169540 RepID=A0A0G4GKM3_VITBC|nr:unnamed protein product [Vitrella brassicaformis CCMP3155]|eukprot:CEM30562.1 unnamed protein product [Vitrella brassicaformis CCMP3155]
MTGSVFSLLQAQIPEFKEEVDAQLRASLLPEVAEERIKHLDACKSTYVAASGVLSVKGKEDLVRFVEASYTRAKKRRIGAFAPGGSLCPTRKAPEAPIGADGGQTDTRRGIFSRLIAVTGLTSERRGPETQAEGLRKRVPATS